MRRGIFACTTALAAAVVLGGCESPQSGPPAMRPQPPVASGLVVPTQEMADLGMLYQPQGWELARNDDSMGLGGVSGISQDRDHIAI